MFYTRVPGDHFIGGTGGWGCSLFPSAPDWAQVVMEAQVRPSDDRAELTSQLQYLFTQGVTMHLSFSPVDGIITQLSSHNCDRAVKGTTDRQLVHNQLSHNSSCQGILIRTCQQTMARTHGKEASAHQPCGMSAKRAGTGQAGWRLGRHPFLSARLC